MFNILKEHIKRGALANGYLLAGKTDPRKLEDFLKTHGEVYHKEGETGVDEIRQIKEMSSRSLGSFKRVFFILNASDMNYYAHTALLKIVEDSLDRHFFILAERPEAVPSTLRSRLTEISSGDFSGEKEDAFSKFMKTEYAGRVKIIETVSEDKKKFNSFLDGMEGHAMQNARHDLLPKIALARESSLVLNIGRKMSLEYLTHLL